MSSESEVILPISGSPYLFLASPFLRFDDVRQGFQYIREFRSTEMILDGQSRLPDPWRHDVG